jgi:hypothetical protein
VPIKRGQSIEQALREFVFPCCGEKRYFEGSRIPRPGQWIYCMRCEASTKLKGGSNKKPKGFTECCIERPRQDGSCPTCQIPKPNLIGCVPVVVKAVILKGPAFCVSIGEITEYAETA